MSSLYIYVTPGSKAIFPSALPHDRRPSPRPRRTSGALTVLKLRAAELAGRICVAQWLSIDVRARRLAPPPPSLWSATTTMLELQDDPAMLSGDVCYRETHVGGTHMTRVSATSMRVRVCGCLCAIDRVLQHHSVCSANDNSAGVHQLDTCRCAAAPDAPRPRRSPAQQRLAQPR